MKAKSLPLLLAVAVLLQTGPRSAGADLMGLFGGKGHGGSDGILELLAAGLIAKFLSMPEYHPRPKIIHVPVYVPMMKYGGMSHYGKGMGHAMGMGLYGKGMGNGMGMGHYGKK